MGIYVFLFCLNLGSQVPVLAITPSLLGNLKVSFYFPIVPICLAVSQHQGPNLKWQFGQGRGLSETVNVGLSALLLGHEVLPGVVFVANRTSTIPTGWL